MPSRLSANLMPETYSTRFYRELSHPREGAVFQICEGESDLWIHTDVNREETARHALSVVRKSLINYMKRDPTFEGALAPLNPLSPCPEPVFEMIRASSVAGVGPMAGVAGMIAQYVGRALVAESASHVLVENGGDLFIYRPRDTTTIGLFAGETPLSLKVGVKIPPSKKPVGIATSSGTVGPSLSFGKADAVCAISWDATLADAAATAIANRIRTSEDLEDALVWGSSLEGVMGIVAILGSTLAAWGSVELIKL